MYYIFLQLLNLDAQVHEFMHQAALSKKKLFQALSGIDTMEIIAYSAIMCVKFDQEYVWFHYGVEFFSLAK